MFFEPYELTAASASVTAILKKHFGSYMTILVISNEEINAIMEAVVTVKDAGILTKGVSGTIKNEGKG